MLIFRQYLVQIFERFFNIDEQLVKYTNFHSCIFLSPRNFYFFILQKSSILSETFIFKNICLLVKNIFRKSCTIHKSEQNLLES